MDLRKITTEEINVDRDDLRKKLLPLLKKDELNNTKLSSWIDNLVNECRTAFKRLLPLNKQEIKFLDSLFDKGNIEPELITNEIDLIANIKAHPAIIWSAQQAQKK